MKTTEEARLREINRQKAELYEAEGMLKLFVERHGKKAQFVSVVSEIERYFSRYES